MADKKSIEQQVAELSQEQQNKIIKVGKIGVAVLLSIAIPWIILIVSGIFLLLEPPAGVDYDKLFIGFETLIALGGLCIFAILIFIKIKYPYYSDAKYKYISKMRKGK